MLNDRFINMSSHDHDDLVERYKAGKQLSQEETDYVRDCSSVSSFVGMCKARAEAIRRPEIDALKVRFPEASFVSLKGGSPKMLVEWSRNDGFIAVVWFDGNEARRDAFHPDALIKCES